MLTYLKEHPSVVGFLLGIIWVASIASFALFVQDSRRLGGDTLSGCQLDGHYYVSTSVGDREISQADWERNSVLAITGMTGFLIAFVLTIYMVVQSALETLHSPGSPGLFDLLPGGSDEGPPVAAEEVGAGHRLLATAAGTWGKVGRLSVARPSLSAEVYSDAIVVSTGPAGPQTLDPRDISWIAYKRRGAWQAVKITHGSKDMGSPIFIGDVDEDSAFGQALNQVVGSAKIV